MIIVFDLDGTLCDISHRLYLIQDGKKKWPDFYKACVDDTPIEPMCALFRTLMKSGLHVVEIWSGRSDIAKEETVAWLKRFDLAPHFLKMRMDGDHRDDVDVKESWLGQERVNGDPPYLVFEDRQRVVDMWRRQGVMCAQVATGDF